MDEVAIAALLYRYARAVDSKDWELYRSVFTDDAVIPWSMHYITNIESEIDGDTAKVRAMFYNPMQLPGIAEMSSCGGYYHHELVRTPEGWRSRHPRRERVVRQLAGWRSRRALVNLPA